MEYHFSRLGRVEQSYYQAIYNAFSAYQEKVRLLYHSPLSGNQIQNACFAVMYDHPELFYVNPGFSASGIAMNIVLHSKFIYSSSEIKTYTAQIDSILNQFKRELSGLDIETVLERIVEYYIANMTYKINNTYNQNAAAIFIRHEGQCTAFARATMLILEKLGIQTIFVNGNGNGAPHAWILVKVNGQFYHFDPTFSFSQNSGIGHFAFRNYLLKSDKSFSLDHAWHKNELPECPNDYPLKNGGNQGGAMVFGNAEFSSNTQHSQANSRNLKPNFPIVKSILDFKKEFKKQYQEGKRIIKVYSEIPNYQGQELLKLIEGALRTALKEINVYSYQYNIDIDGSVIAIFIAN